MEDCTNDSIRLSSNEEIQNWSCTIDTVVKPILTYGCESWVLNKQIKSRIQAVEMKYLRGIKGSRLRDKIRNEVLRKDKLNVE